MRIDPKTPVAPASLDPKEVAPGKPQVKQEPAAVVRLSTAGTAASQATEKSMAQKIDKIRAAVLRGEYPIDLDKLASRIVDDEVVRGGVK